MVNKVKDVLFAVLGFLTIILIAMMVQIGGCSDPEGAKRVLRQQGFTEVEITGWRPFSASKGDTYSTGFRAKAPNGEPVTGAVTSGFWKGHTVRLD